MRSLLPLAALSLFALGCTNGSGSDETRFNVRKDPNLPDTELVPATHLDRHSQVGVPAVDVLWVVDNSRSMYEEQQALANNFTSFMDYFATSDMDYHIAVMSTGWDDEAERGKFRTSVDARDQEIRWIDNDTREPEAVFRDMALMGIEGPMEEKGRAQIYTGLQLLGDTENFGFLRDDAFLAVIVLSDEDDATGDVPVAFDGFVGWMRNLKADATQVSFSSIVGPDGGCGNAVEGTEYLALTRELGGVEHSICNPSWANVLEDLGMQAAGLKDEFPLSQLPDPDTIEAYYKVGRDIVPQTINYNFNYNRERNSIIFIDEVPPPESVLFIEYEILDSAR